MERFCGEDGFNPEIGSFGSSGVRGDRSIVAGGAASASPAVRCSELRAVSIRPPLSRRFHAPTLPRTVYRYSARSLSLSHSLSISHRTRVEPPFSVETFIEGDVEKIGGNTRCPIEAKALLSPPLSLSAELALLRRAEEEEEEEGSRIGHPAATLTLIYSRDTRVKI